MELRKFGNTDLLVTPISYGAWEIGGYPFFSNISNEESLNVVRKAYESGINFFDTAPVYGFGRSEKLIGKAVKKFRKKIYISTKCGLRWKEEKIKSIFKNSSKDSILEEIDLSLKRLDTDYIDLYLIHWYDNESGAAVSESIEALEKIKKAGKIRYYGVSNFSLENLNEAVENNGIISGLQSNYSMLVRDIENKELKFCRDNNIGFQAYSPLHRGLLTDKTIKSLRDKKSAAVNNILNQTSEEAISKAEKIREISKKYNIPFAQFVINWTINRRGITTAIIGSTKPKHIEEAVQACSLKINKSDLNKISEILG